MASPFLRIVNILERKPWQKKTVSPPYSGALPWKPTSTLEIIVGPWILTDSEPILSGLNFLSLDTMADIELQEKEKVEIIFSRFQICEKVNNRILYFC